MDTKYPDIHVQLTGTDRNPYAIISRVCAAMKDYGCSAREVAEFQKEAMSGDYDHLIQTAILWVDVA